MSARKSSVNLYWVTTLDHAEDWFIFARTSRSAARYHEDAEGYDPHDAKATLVIAHVQLPKFEDETPCHADIAALISLGFDIDESEPDQQIVRFEGELYVEGYLQSLVVQGNQYLREAAASIIPINTKRRRKPS